MKYRLLKSKIHRVKVTDTQIDYDGSITIDEDLMDAAGIVAYEKVLVANVTNGTRHETYVVKDARGSGNITVMGAAAHLVNTGDLVIIMAFTDVDDSQLANHKPKVILVDQNNHARK